MPHPAGFRHLPGHISTADQVSLLAEIERALEEAPLFVPRMPRSGTPMSVRMSNFGPLGWVTDKERGYRYQRVHPETGLPWPPMPELVVRLWRELSDFPAPPEACLVNWYAEGTKMGLHQDKDEQDFSAPVLSISLGDEAVFVVGGTERTGKKERIRLKSGDVVVLGGEARLAFHGIDKTFAGTSPLPQLAARVNLTLRRVTEPS